MSVKARDAARPVNHNVAKGAGARRTVNANRNQRGTAHSQNQGGRGVGASVKARNKVVQGLPVPTVDSPDSVHDGALFAVRIHVARALKGIPLSKPRFKRRVFQVLRQEGGEPITVRALTHEALDAAEKQCIYMPDSFHG